MATNEFVAIRIATLPGETRKEAVRRTLKHFPIVCLSQCVQDHFGNRFWEEPVIYNSLDEIPLTNTSFHLPNQWVVKFERELSFS